jgi:hypothetical protein
MQITFKAPALILICIPWEPETVNRKGLQVTISLEAPSALKNWR